MGACVKPESRGSKNKEINRNTFSLEIKKGRHEIEIMKEKMMQNLRQQEKKLVQQFSKPNATRTQKLEEAAVQRIVSGINRVQVSQSLINHIEKLIAYSDSMGNKERAQLTVYPSFRFILYCESIFHDNNLSEICNKIRKYDSKIKQASEEQIGDSMVIEAKKRTPPNKKMCSDYVLKLCQQESLDLGQINSIGHGYKYEF